MSNIWHDISPDRIQPEDFVAVIEIPKGSKKKYELDKETGLIILDRVLYTSTHYPANYGFIPRTYGDDGDPLDVLVVCSESIDPLTLVRCYPIGYISMLDGGKNDEKIIAIPFSDPTYNNVQDLMDLPPHLFDEMAHFFSVYKALEGKETVAKDVNDRAAAVEVIRKAMEHYAECFLGGAKAKEELKKSPSWPQGHGALCRVLSRRRQGQGGVEEVAVVDGTGGISIEKPPGSLVSRGAYCFNQKD